MKDSCKIKSTLSEFQKQGRQTDIEIKYLTLKVRGRGNHESAIEPSMKSIDTVPRELRFSNSISVKI